MTEKIMRKILVFSSGVALCCLALLQPSCAAPATSTMPAPPSAKPVGDEEVEAVAANLQVVDVEKVVAACFDDRQRSLWCPKGDCLKYKHR